MRTASKAIQARSRPPASAEAATRRLTDRRRSLIAAARSLIAERGFEGLRTRDVAQRVGLNHATLHHYFATKEALIEAVVRELVSELATYRTAQHASAMSARDALRTYLTAARAQMREDPAPFIVLGEFFRRAERTRALSPIIRELEQGWSGFLTSLLRRGQRDGDFGRAFDPATVAHLLTTYLRGIRLPLQDKGAAVTREHAQLEVWITGKRARADRSGRRR